MRIDALLGDNLPIGQRGTAAPASGMDFAAALRQAAAVKHTAPAPAADLTASDIAESRRKRSEAAHAAHAAAANDLRDYLNKTPAEHLREAVLKDMGLTEEELQAMPPEQRTAMEAEITRRIKERLAAKTDGPKTEWSAPTPAASGAIQLATGVEAVRQQTS